MKLYGKLMSPFDLNQNHRERMFYIMSCYFDGMKREAFENDLDEKKWVIVLFDKISKTIQGFSTLQLIEVFVQNKLIRAVFSGDTIIDKKYWGETELSGVWGSLILKLIDEDPKTPLYWFLISKGIRTYKFLPTYFNEFYPRYDRVTPQYEQTLISKFAQKKFSNLYDENTGIIQCFKGDHLNKEMAAIEESQLKNPHVRYFLKKNPGYWKGEELACLALLSYSNLKPLTKKIFKRYTYDEACAT